MKRILYYLSEIPGEKAFEIRKAIIIEMISRSIKIHVNEQWRENANAKTISQTDAKKTLYSFLVNLCNKEKETLLAIQKMMNLQFRVNFLQVSFLLDSSFPKIFRRLQKLLHFGSKNQKSSDPSSVRIVKFDFESEAEFISETILQPKIKNFPYHTRYDLISVMSVQGENGLAEIRTQLITQLNEREKTEQMNFLLLPLYQSFAQCTFLLLKGISFLDLSR